MQVSVRTRRRHSAPSEVPRRRVRTATPAALFFLRHGVSDISDGMLLASRVTVRGLYMICARRSNLKLIGRCDYNTEDRDRSSDRMEMTVTLVVLCVHCRSRLPFKPRAGRHPRHVLVIPPRHAVGAGGPGCRLADACARVDDH